MLYQPVLLFSLLILCHILLLQEKVEKLENIGFHLCFPVLLAAVKLTFQY